jgi:hypothetical protein
LADAALEPALIADNVHEAHVAMGSAVAVNRPASHLRFLFAVGVELDASFEALFDEFTDRLGTKAMTWPRFERKSNIFWLDSGHGGTD